MNIHKPPKWVRHIYNDVIFFVNDNSKKLYLTFDDGPTPIVTEWVLDELKKYNAKATFFCIGRNVEHYPKIYNRIIKESHSVGNHTYSHLKGWLTNNKEYLNDVELASNYIDSNLFRPPYGKIKKKQIKELINRNYKIVMWNVLSEDYNNSITPQMCLNNITENVENGSIILFHDSIKASNNLYEVLPKILTKYKEMGYSFCKLI